LANEHKKPLVVVFGLTGDYPEANLRHYRFMLEGLADTRESLTKRGMILSIRVGSPPDVALKAAQKACLVVCDRGYLSHLRQWRYDVARTASCRVVEVESDLIVPVEAASTKQEYAARTIRGRIHARLGEFLVPFPEAEVKHPAAASVPRGEDVRDTAALLRRLAPSPTPGAVDTFFRGGHAEARRRLDRFIAERLDDYEESRSEPGSDVSTTLSPYLHFGQISSLEIALAVDAAGFVAGLAVGAGEMKLQRGSVGVRVDTERRASARDALLEELLVRRGLAHNYVWYAPDHGRYAGLPDWARRTLADHSADPREHVYSTHELLAAETHDPHWNDAMREMLATGFMHNYMRMYWGKKILEWTADPEEAFDRTLELNNRWFLDGRDPNSYANVAWVFGLHDRPWTERPVFGKVRYMNANGLNRKFDMAAYTRKVRALEDRADARS